MLERLGPAAATLDELLADPAQHGSYDFAFIDADKKVSGWLRACAVVNLAWRQRRVCCCLALSVAAVVTLLVVLSMCASWSAPVCTAPQGYRAYYEQLLQLVRPGGVIAIDNTLWYGRVADVENTDGATLALRELNAFLVADERIMFSLVPVGDGMCMCTKL